MKCEDVRQMLSAYVDGELSDAETRDVSSHVQGCTGCASAHEALLKTVQSLRALPEADPPPWLTTRVMARVREVQKESERGFLRRLLAPARIRVPIQAVAVALLAVVSVYVYQAARPALKAPVKQETREEDSRTQAPSAIDKVRVQGSAQIKEAPAGLKRDVDSVSSIRPQGGEDAADELGAVRAGEEELNRRLDDKRSERAATAPAAPAERTAPAAPAGRAAPTGLAAPAGRAAPSEPERENEKAVSLMMKEPAAKPEESLLEAAGRSSITKPEPASKAPAIRQAKSTESTKLANLRKKSPLTSELKFETGKYREPEGSLKDRKSSDQVRASGQRGYLDFYDPPAPPASPAPKVAKKRLAKSAVTNKMALERRTAPHQEAPRVTLYVNVTNTLKAERNIHKALKALDARLIKAETIKGVRAMDIRLDASQYPKLIEAVKRAGTVMGSKSAPLGKGRVVIRIELKESG